MEDFPKRCSVGDRDMFQFNAVETDPQFIRRQSVPWGWKPLMFDPFQVFEVAHYPCALLYIRVVQGYNITKGWAGDLMDTPDPYVKMRIQNSPNGIQRTTCKDNDINPVWDETFKFCLDPRVDNDLEITLMDANYLIDEHLCTQKISLKPLPYQKRRQKVMFNKTSEVEIEMWAEDDADSKLRYSLMLCDEEKEFVDVRRRHIYAAMKRLLGEDGPRTVREVPTIAVIGSGGGFRAMTSLSGVFSALVENHVLDMTTYAAGLSGSAWYISQLYSNPEWPMKTPGDMTEELKKNIASSPFWLLGPQSMYRYLSRIIEKRRLGQPVSFTDFFGHLVGETLLKGRLDAKLTDQKQKLRDGSVPMPLYTCLHVKKHVSAMVFHEWMEFSPFEIGMPKYGTFMRSELFGSKFFMGHCVQEYSEPHLHFLQGIWGSAFCIQFKHLLNDNKNVDMVDMMRWEREELVDELTQELDTEDCETSDSEWDPEEEKNGSGSSRGSPVAHDERRGSRTSNTMPDPEERRGSRTNLEVLDPNNRRGSRTSLDVPDSSQRRGSRTSLEVPDSSQRRGSGASMEATNGDVKRRGSTMEKTFWGGMVEKLFDSSLLQTIEGRAAMVHNFMRGLSLYKMYPFSPFTSVDNSTRMENQIVEEEDQFDGIFEMYPTSMKKLYIVDGGLTFNSPFPLVLRPQRNVDLILSFDFSARPSDSTPPFKELLLAEKWAQLNKVSFPKIDPKIFDREGMKECYVFENPSDPNCPVVLHFVLVNITFRNEKSPGVPRETEEEKEFADFDIFDDPERPYSTFNFKYTNKSFDRLTQLTKFNTLLNTDLIMTKIKQCIKKRSSTPTKGPIKLKDIKKLKLQKRNSELLFQFLQSFDEPRSEDTPV